MNQEKEKKRQQEEAEKEQKQHEKEEAEMKKQLAIQKQATPMDRFLKKDAPNTQTMPTVLNETIYNSLQENAQICSGVMLSMDKILLKAAEAEIGDLLSLMF